MSDCESGSVPTTTASSSPTHLVGIEDDPLVPSASEICRTFHDGQATWARLLGKSHDCPRSLWPATFLDPYLMLMDAPALPTKLPRGRTMYGRPLWRVPRLEPTPTQPMDGVGEWDPELVHGCRSVFNLETKSPLCCHLSSKAASSFLSGSSNITDSLAITTLCWSYILSVRLLELQCRQVKYTSHRLKTCKTARGNSGALQLDGASPALVRWLCAILTPELGWSAGGEGLPPWTACIQEPIVIETSEPTPDPPSPPSSAEALELLLELCRLFGLQMADKQENRQWEELSPCRAGFFAALMLPFYRFMALRPQFSLPRLTRSDDGSSNSGAEYSIRRCFGDLRYFMTLSIHPPSIGSTLWSIFWQPDIKCNLVSPWLASILDVLRPTLEARDIETLLKTFGVRRPRVAIWWLALLLLGDLSVLDWIERYAQTCMEKWGYGSLSPPDPTASAWTGTRQSFLDQEVGACYSELSDQIPMADILRRRFDLSLQSPYRIHLSWSPFGFVSKKSVEPELWPYLETKRRRQYQSFLWYSAQGRLRVSDAGFRRNTGRSIVDVRDDLTLQSSGRDCVESHDDIKLIPSKEATLSMISSLVEDATGSRQWSNAGMADETQQHPWLHDWEGLATSEGLIRGEEDAAQAKKPPSWFLGEWMRGEHDGIEEAHG